MKQYRVTLQGEAREVYIVDADNEDEARATWPSSGWRESTESMGMDVVSVDLDYTDEDDDL